MRAICRSAIPVPMWRKEVSRGAGHQGAAADSDVLPLAVERDGAHGRSGGSARGKFGKTRSRLLCRGNALRVCTAGQLSRPAPRLPVTIARPSAITTAVPSRPPHPAQPSPLPPHTSPVRSGIYVAAVAHKKGRQVPASLRGLRVKARISAPAALEALADEVGVVLHLAADREVHKLVANLDLEAAEQRGVRLLAWGMGWQGRVRLCAVGSVLPVAYCRSSWTSLSLNFSRSPSAHLVGDLNLLARLDELGQGLLDRALHRAVQRLRQDGSWEKPSVSAQRTCGGWVHRAAAGACTGLQRTAAGEQTGAAVQLPTPSSPGQRPTCAETTLQATSFRVAAIICSKAAIISLDSGRRLFSARTPWERGGGWRVGSRRAPRGKAKASAREHRFALRTKEVARHLRVLLVLHHGARGLCRGGRGEKGDSASAGTTR